MDNKINQFTKEFINELKKSKPQKNYSLFNLKFNPFPSAGLPRFLSLSPLDSEVSEKIIRFLRSTYMATKEEEYAGLTILGDFGMGKTHVMKYIIEQINILNKLSLENRKDIKFSAIACFIDKPEDKPQSVVHNIVEQIGIDNIRKYIGRIILDRFQENKSSFYNKFKPKQMTLLTKPETEWKQLFEEPAASNYLEFLSRFNEVGGDLKLLQEEARNIIKERVVKDSTLADRYLDLIFEEKKADSSWDILAGYVSNRNIQRKEVMFLNSIVKILRQVGFRQLYVFVDEFEDVSKLTGAKLRDYLITLNTLINQEKRWALVVSLTPEALKKIKVESAPLYDRLTSYKINLNPLNPNKANLLLINYLNLARDEESNNILPFNKETVREMLKISKGNYRSFILIAHKAIEVALAKNRKSIDKKILEKARELRYDEE
jgi:Cdc6-like AAA superfamily ATPase